MYPGGEVDQRIIDIFSHPGQVPVPDPRARREKNLPKGEIPSAIDPPPGCHFHPRCPFAIARCREARPPLREVSPGHFSACILD